MADSNLNFDIHAATTPAPLDKPAPSESRKPVMRGHAAGDGDVAQAGRDRIAGKLDTTPYNVKALRALKHVKPGANIGGRASVVQNFNGGAMSSARPPSKAR